MARQNHMFVSGFVGYLGLESAEHLLHAGELLLPLSNGRIEDCRAAANRNYAGAYNK